MLSRDAKNYHVWSYRQWLVRHFSLWDTWTNPSPSLSHSPSQGKDPKQGQGHGQDQDQKPDEIVFIENLLTQDVRNNSAWNHRWFVVFGRYELPASGKASSSSPSNSNNDQPNSKPKTSVNDDNDKKEPYNTLREREKASANAIRGTGILERELAFTKAKIELAPQNPSPWNYFRGILRLQGKGLMVEKEFVEQFADLNLKDDNDDEDTVASSKEKDPPLVRSSHALDFLADMYSAELQSQTQIQGEREIEKEKAEETTSGKQEVSNKTNDHDEHDDDIENRNTSGDKGKYRSSDKNSAGVEDDAVRRRQTRAAGRALEFLATRYDPIRKNYWNWRRSLIGLGEVGVNDDR